VHGLLSLQLMAAPALHVPLAHVEPVVHALVVHDVPLATGAHVPADPDTLHALHAPHDVAVVLQHTPSTHVPTEHCALDVHAAPYDGVPDEPEELPDDAPVVPPDEEPEEVPDEVPEELPVEDPDELPELPDSGLTVTVNDICD